MGVRMTTVEPLYKALLRVEACGISDEQRAELQPAFAALHGAQAIALPEQLVTLIRTLDPGPQENDEI